MYVKEIKGRNFNAEKWLRAQRDFSWKLSGLSETIQRLGWGDMESAALHTPLTPSIEYESCVVPLWPEANVCDSS